MADKHTVDARGLSCPQPVLMTKKALQANPSANAFEIIVDNGTAKENVTRFAEKQGYKVSYSAEGEDFRLKLNK